MAVKVATVVVLNDDEVKVTWTNMANGDTGAPVSENWGAFSDRTVQLKGTLGAGGNCRVEGSNDDGATFQALNDRANAALNLAALATKAVNETTQQIRPNITAGDGTTSLTLTMIMRRPQRSNK